METLLGTVEGYLHAGSPIAYAVVFLSGVLIGFTPCVYPAIPITVAYIGSRSRGSRARGLVLGLAYAGGMAVVYAFLGGLAALTGKVFGAVAASPVSYLVVGGVCLLLALSLFDLFALALPSIPGLTGISRRTDGVPGAAAVGMASGLVVGPCTAPVLGALLLYVGSRQNVAYGMSQLFVFALGMGLLPVALGVFSGFLAHLPKPGAWTTAIRKGFGLLMLAVAAFYILEAGRLLA